MQLTFPLLFIALLKKYIFKVGRWTNNELFFFFCKDEWEICQEIKLNNNLK